MSAERVRQLVVADQLPGVRFGNAWAVPSDAVDARRRQANRRGRPLGPRRAWDEIIDGDVDLVDAGRYRSRGMVHRYEIGPGDRAHLTTHDAILSSGVAGAIGYGEPLSPVGAAVALYVAASFHAVLDSMVALVDDALGTLAVWAVDDDVWPIVLEASTVGTHGRRLAPRAAVALDLMTSDDPRHRRAAQRLVGVDG